MKEVRIQAFCDWTCDRTEATEERTVNGYLLDLCEACVSEVDAFLSEVATRGLVAKRQGRKKRPLAAEEVEAGAGTNVCPECQKPLKNRGSMLSHMRRTHGVSIKDYQAS